MKAVTKGGRCLIAGLTLMILLSSTDAFSAIKSYSSKKSPTTAFLLSAVPPAVFLFGWPLCGLGQYYNEQWPKFGASLVGGLAAVSMARAGNATYYLKGGRTVGKLGVVLYYSIWLVSAIDAPIAARKINRTYFGDSPPHAPRATIVLIPTWRATSGKQSLGLCIVLNL